MSPPQHADTTDNGERDPYAEVIASFKPGLLITVNQSTPSTYGTDELTVVLVDDGPRVELRSSGGQIYELSVAADGVVLTELDTEGVPRSTEFVETVEVVGLE